MVESNVDKCTEYRTVMLQHLMYVLYRPVVIVVLYRPVVIVIIPIPTAFMNTDGREVHIRSQAETSKACTPVHNAVQYICELYNNMPLYSTVLLTVVECYAI